MPLSDVMTVADDILRVAKAKGRALTPLQLMKLTYIAHGVSLGRGEGDLFNSRIEAWKYGPVIPDLYHTTKIYGREPIPLDRVADGRALTGAAAGIVDEVMEKYGHLDGIALSNLTHRAGTPWSQTYRDGQLGLEIPDATIAAHYRALLGQA
jgi:uncharacterized phage-associated protein